VVELWQNLVDLVVVLGRLIGDLGRVAFSWSLLLFWLAWWLWGVNWKKAWGVLAQGAWAPLLLIMLIGALVWSQVSPSDCNCLGFTTVPNFWWQLGSVGLLAAVTLGCGWLQGVFGWTPAEWNLDPPAVGHGHGHGHDHGHGHEPAPGHGPSHEHGHGHH
jgi:hypothetical protein